MVEYEKNKLTSRLGNALEFRFAHVLLNAGSIGMPSGFANILGWQHLRYFVVLTIFLTGHPGAANLCFLVPLCFVVSFVALFGN